MGKKALVVGSHDSPVTTLWISADLRSEQRGRPLYLHTVLKAKVRKSKVLEVMNVVHA